MSDAPNTEEGREFTPAERERWLWAYAANLLEPKEEAAIAWLIARDSSAQKRLAEIRRAFDTVALRSGSSLETARARAQDWGTRIERLFASATQHLLRGFEKCGEELAAGIAVTAILAKGSLFARVQQPGWAAVPLPPTVLGEASEGDVPDQETASQELTAPDGTKVTLVSVGPEAVDVLVELSDKTKTGVAELRRVVEKDGRIEKTVIAVASIEAGTVEFRQCSSGFLEIELPGSPSMLMAVALADMPGANC